MENRRRLSPRFWCTVLVLGLSGQLAWTIENMYLNVYLYNMVSASADAIAMMVAASGVVATLTTLFMGALSDRLGRRRAFVVIGYLLWGASTAAFGFVSLDSVRALFPTANAVLLTTVSIILLDCVMTFFGSSANDAAFNSYVTESTDKSNRGRVETVLVTLPLISMLIIFGFFDGMTKAGNWRAFFLIFGIAVILVGILAIFLMPKEKPAPSREPYFKNIFYGFRPSVIKENGDLYIALLAFCLFNVSVQVFFPYLIIYIQTYLKLEGYALILGVVLIVSSLLSVLSGRWMDRIGKLRFTLPATVVMLIGLLLMFFVRRTFPVILAGIVMMGGYMFVNAALSGIIRDKTPADRVGLFQGIRMIFQVLLPMVTGPSIGSLIIRYSKSGTYEELGVVKQVPIPFIFIGAAFVLLLSLIPTLILARREKMGKSDKS